jgi:hypothetical protein
MSREPGFFARSTEILIVFKDQQVLKSLSSWTSKLPQ